MSGEQMPNEIVRVPRGIGGDCGFLSASLSRLGRRDSGAPQRESDASKVEMSAEMVLNHLYRRDWRSNSHRNRG